MRTNGELREHPDHRDAMYGVPGAVRDGLVPQCPGSRRSAMPEHRVEVHDAVVAIDVAKVRVQRARDALQRAKAAFDKTVAEAVSTEPASVTWYSAPGYVEPELARATGGLTACQLDDLMDRHRRAAAKKGGRR